MAGHAGVRFGGVIFYLPLLLVVGATTLYHVAQKSVSPQVNPMLSVTVNYVTALIVSLLILPLYPGNSLRASWKNLNWASVAVGVAIVGIELGFVVAYRAGWRISVASLIANVATALLLVGVGLVFFREHLNGRNALGIMLCIAGLGLVMYR
jgi:drug/metabolite transporter (DMT)-like permease